MGISGRGILFMTRRSEGGKLSMLNIIDEYTLEYLCIHVDRQINAGKVKKNLF